MEFKYIMMSCGDTDIPIIFPQTICHINMVKAVRGLTENLTNPTDKFWTLVSAGFVNLLTCECFGESESCRPTYPNHYKSRPELDTMIIMLYQWQHGVFEPVSARILIDALKAEI